ncbi:hypothetical protein [Fusibacter ferrireducens]|uniref:PKD domain-containing protein n=1 Tax=Fusibacter ferrireducens TaxID=2785058 RepID=A0ABR9ZQR7_9FIRM|nr:hypothetical protein [Fusibacter ferrireducens]MBF4692789.1 hypothetical protein [Fusibacter ferrireducens]
MNLSNFRVEKLIHEDSFQRFSTGYLDDEPAEINLISIKNPASILTTTRLLIADHLYNVLDVFEEQNELHIVLRHPLGIPLETYLVDPDGSYDQRIYLGLSLLKALNKYDTFSNAIKYQLLEDDQILIHNGVICFKELIDYTTITHHSFKDVIFRSARLLERLVQPETDFHQQFIDNLLIGNHHYYTISDLLQDYKDIFIYEKPEILTKIAYEYHLVLEQNNQGSSLSKTSEAITHTQPLDSDSNSPESLIDIDIASTDPIEKVQSEEANDGEDESTPFDALASREDPFAESELLRSELSKLLFTEEVTLTMNTRTLPSIDDMDATFAEVRRAHKNAMPVENTKQTAKFPEWDDEQLVTESDTLLEDLFTEDEPEPNHWKKILLSVAVLLTLVLIIFLANKFLFHKDTELRASYEINTLADNRVAFVNTSSNLKNLDLCEWTVYYDDKLIETYEAENFYPIFDTEGKYKVVLRVMDKEGNWSKEYKQDYVYTSDSKAPSNSKGN